MPYFVGVDVGTTSVRAGIFDQNGSLFAQATQQIQLFYPQSKYIEQSSEEIWSAVCTSVLKAIENSEVRKEDVLGIGFDATCSLVILSKDETPLPASVNGDPSHNVILWMDHRAEKETDRINQTKSRVLDFVGGKISPEMEIPKLLWLKENNEETWKKAGVFFDLPDFLTWKATGSTKRSICSTTCKWTYLSKEEKWDSEFFREIGLEEVVSDGFEKIGNEIRNLGEAVGELTEKGAEELGLMRGIKVSVSIIDAHAGTIGTIGARGNDIEKINFDSRISLICGTSDCVMALSPMARFIPGVWGPYFSAVLPNLWLNEGGQSATGALLDHLFSTNPDFENLKAKAEEENLHFIDYLNQLLFSLRNASSECHLLAKDLHILPYFHGNRSPRADPSLRGSIVGLNLTKSTEDLLKLYLATVQSIALGHRHIIEEMNRNGYSIKEIIVTGGGAKNALYLQEIANATKCVVLLCENSEAMILGSAILASVAANFCTNLEMAMKKMTKISKTIQPNEKLESFYDKKFAVFLEMYEDQKKYREIIEK
ncbi:unnamed protein product, partial [Mesorhabditis belari]|uniref:FGGY carbohydrate kinase domain-containing protein n=1 Tax=Mesorhabditis belari TaxID=2138241 RepID=A0AAF3J7C9_9BILA